MKKFLLATTLLLTLVLGGCQYLPWNKSAETPSDSTSDTSAASPEIDYSSYNKTIRATRNRENTYKWRLK